MFDKFWHKVLSRPYRLHVSSFGRPDAPIIVLLHGLAGSGRDWKHFLPLLAVNYRCVIIDLLGFGASPKPQWCAYTPEDHLASLRHTINQLQLSSYILVGYSLGGLLATNYARQFPTDISRLLLLSPPVYPPLTQIHDHTARRATSVLLILYRSVRGKVVTPQLMRRLSYILPMFRPTRGPDDSWLPTVRSLENCIETQTILQDIEQVQVPVDIWYGKRDQVVIGANVRQLNKLPGVTTHEFDGNHILTGRYAKIVSEQM